jgi:MFS superfamily sulfate permease-like transporter
MSTIVTILGVITAVASAMASELSVINPRAGLYVMLLGVGAAAAGKALDPRALRRGIPRRGSFTRKRVKRFVLALCVLTLVTSQTACADVGEKVVRYADKGERAVTRLHNTQLLDAEDADLLKPLIADVRSAGVELASVEQAVKTSKEDAATKREQVRVASQAVAASLRKLERDGVLRVKNAEARRHLQRALAIAETILEFT